jgi:hypothetical protein
LLSRPAVRGIDSLEELVVLSCGGAPLSILKQYIEQQDNPE